MVQAVLYGNINVENKVCILTQNNSIALFPDFAWFPLRFRETDVFISLCNQSYTENALNTLTLTRIH